MQPLSDRIAQADRLLAPYAVPHGGLMGRTTKEPNDETRFPFQRDRDRIIHTQAFRRLKGKTQVFVASADSSTTLTASDHVRTRLTHTLEVAQISRDCARTLGLNEDLAECIALAHDLGHPPFGHTGEEALDSFLKEHGSGFEHNAQSLRIVTVLEEHSALHKGLNLNREVLEGLQKHSTPHDFPAGPLHAPTLEAAVVNLADEIAYTAHDCDDGISAKLFDRKTVTAVPLACEAAERAETRGTSLRGALIHLLVTDLYAATEASLRRSGITSLDHVLHAKEPLVRFSESMEKKLQELRAFLWQHLYLHPHVRSSNEAGRSIVLALCTSYEADPPTKVSELQKTLQSSLPEAIKDYVAGMTDAYAQEQSEILVLKRKSPLG